MRTLIITLLACLSSLVSNAQQKQVMYRNGAVIDSAGKGIKETKLETIQFLNKDAELKEAIGVEQIEKVVESITKIFSDLFNASTSPGKIMVEVELVEKGKPSIQFAVRDDLDLDKMKIFEKQVLNTSFPNTRKRPITIRLVYKVNSFDDER